MEDIVEALAVEGLGELAEVLRAARADAGTAQCPLRPMACAYLCFSARQPALYDAMFTRATKLPFAADDIPAPW
jgi:hypothetical protein